MGVAAFSMMLMNEGKMSNDLSINMQLPGDLSAEMQKRSGMLAYVQEAYPTIDSIEVANEASADRKRCKGIITWFRDQKGGFVADAKKIIARAEALFDPGMENAEMADAYLGTKLLEFEATERERVAAARRAQEEQDRRIRAEAEAKAAAIRAKAEEQAKEDARKAQEAAAALAKAQAEGNAREAAKLAAANAKAAAEAESRAEADRIEAIQVESEAAARIAAAPTIEATKVDGLSVRKNWKAELAVATPEEAVMAIVRAIPTRPELVAFLDLNMTALHKQAKALEKNFNIPGLRSVNKAVAASVKS